MGRLVAPRLQVLPGAEVADPLSTVLHGLVAAARFRLTIDKSFSGLRDQTFATPPAAGQEAATAALFAAFVPALAVVGSSNLIPSLLNTPRVASSFSTTYGPSATRAARSYRSLRANADASNSDGAVWLFALLGSALWQGSVGTALAGLDPFVAAQARLELAQARRLVSLSL